MVSIFFLSIDDIYMMPSLIAGTFHVARVACVAAVAFPFQGGDRTSERKSGRAKEHAWGEQKNWGEVGRG